MFEIRRIEEQSQDDPRLMTPPQIRAFAKQGGGLTIAAMVRSSLAAQHTDARFWPKALVQQGDSCQTMALINGIRCYQAAAGRRTWDPDFREVEHIRQEASQQSSDDSRHQANSVARYLQSQGLLDSIEAMQQPIKAAETMARGGFAVMTAGINNGWHATTIVPNLPRFAAGNSIPELTSIDSLNGYQSPLYAAEFSSRILGLDWTQDEALICTVGSAALIN